MNQSTQLIADDVFSWKAVERRLKSALFMWSLPMFSFCLSLAAALISSPLISTYGPLAVYSAAIGATALVGYILYLAFFVGVRVLRNTSYMKASIIAWQNYAQKVEEEKSNIGRRKIILTGIEDAALFKNTVDKDESFLKKYENSTHEQELMVFVFAMEHAYPTPVGRILALSLGYNYWLHRMTPKLV